MLKATLEAAWKRFLAVLIPVGGGVKVTCGEAYLVLEVGDLAPNLLRVASRLVTPVDGGLGIEARDLLPGEMVGSEEAVWGEGGM